MGQLVNEKFVSMITGLALQTLRNARCERRGIPYIRLGGAIRYDLQDVENHIKAHRIDPETLADCHPVREK